VKWWVAFSDRVAGRDVLTQTKDHHPHLTKGWVDGGYANTVGSSIIDWTTRTPGIDCVVAGQAGPSEKDHTLPVGGEVHDRWRDRWLLVAAIATTGSHRSRHRS
jgi:hypothetical protein